MAHRHTLNLDFVPAGVSANGDDNINYMTLVPVPSLPNDFPTRSARLRAWMVCRRSVRNYRPSKKWLTDRENAARPHPGRMFDEVAGCFNRFAARAACAVLRAT